MKEAHSKPLNFLTTETLDGILRADAARRDRSYGYVLNLALRAFYARQLAKKANHGKRGNVNNGKPGIVQGGNGAPARRKRARAKV